MVELLVVISIIAVLTGIFAPSLAKARRCAKIVSVNSDIYGIAIALEAYAAENNNRYPPTRSDCSSPEHLYSLPPELATGRFLPEGRAGRIVYGNVEDRFNPGFTYKYIATGPRYDNFGTCFGRQSLYIPEGFPANNDDANLQIYDDASKSPVTWVLFSLGPEYIKDAGAPGDYRIYQGCPLLKKFWYTQSSGRGVLTRIRLLNGRHIGTF